MRISSDSLRYGAVAQLFHWTTVVLVGVAYLLGEGGPESRVYSADRASTLNLHETFGILVFAIVVLRVVWRIFDRAPEEPPMAAWMLYASRLTHWLLYILLVTIPLTAIFGAFFEGHAVTFLGTAIGPLTGASSSLGQTLTSLHTNLGSFIVYVAGLHAAAALFHHFILRDRVLMAMLPWRSSGA